MRKIVFSIAVAMMAVPALAFADSGPGCGVGTQIFKGQSGLPAHTFAATTNGSTMNQWFGLTSGSLECNPSAMVSNEYQREVFVASNMDNLTQEMSQGRGDHLEVLATLMGIEEADMPRFTAMTQQEFSVLVASSDAKTMLATLDLAMAADTDLAKYVR